MRIWGTDSQRVYDELDSRLQLVMTRVRDEVGDLTLVEGFRDEIRQNRMFDLGASQLRWPDGKHNQKPSKAVDMQPYPLPDTEDKLWAGLAYLASAAILIAKEEGVTLRWGGDWNRNGSLTDQKFYDLFHLEIVDTPHDEISTPSPSCLPADAWRLKD